MQFHPHGICVQRRELQLLGQRVFRQEVTQLHKIRIRGTKIELLVPADIRAAHTQRYPRKGSRRLIGDITAVDLHCPRNLRQLVRAIICHNGRRAALRADAPLERAR